MFQVECTEKLQGKKWQQQDTEEVEGVQVFPWYQCVTRGYKQSKVENSVVGSIPSAFEDDVCEIDLKASEIGEVARSSRGIWVGDGLLYVVHESIPPFVEYSLGLLFSVACKRAR